MQGTLLGYARDESEHKPCFFSANCHAASERLQRQPYKFCTNSSKAIEEQKSRAEEPRKREQAAYEEQDASLRAESQARAEL